MALFFKRRPGGANPPSSMRRAITTLFARGDDRAVLTPPTQSAEMAELRADLERMRHAVAESDRRLNEALEHQAELTRELHHRVKNNLQIIISLLTLQARRIHDPAARKVLDQARVRIHALALVHRLLYEEGEAADINARVLSEQLCQQLRTNFSVRSNIALNCDADEFAMPIPIAMPYTLLIVELVSNALHYAFVDGRAGQINMVLREHAGGANLHVGDDGIGTAAIPLDSGSGIQLVHAFAGQLGGTLHLTSKLGAGVQADLEMRWPQQRAAIF
jgi:two-component sensor histidine kinase